MQRTLPKLTTCLWFDDQAEEAMQFYATVFDNARIAAITHYGEAGHEIHQRPKDSVMTVKMSIHDQEFLGLNGGPVFKLNPAISLYVACPSVSEVDALFRKLSNGGAVLMELNKYPFSERFAWVNDKFGVSWQLNYTDKTFEKISPCLMFTGEQSGRAEEAINFYTSIFNHSSIDYIIKYEPGESAPATVKHAAFKLDGRQFIAMDSPIQHSFGFTPATSFVVNCTTQEEIDRMWAKLQADGGAPGQCGWLTDKFGVSWQVVPEGLQRMFSAGDKTKRESVMASIMTMTKLDIEQLEKAYRG